MVNFVLNRYKKCAGKISAYFGIAGRSMSLAGENQFKDYHRNEITIYFTR